MAIGVAVIGVGLFARDEHIPAIKQSEHFELKAVYSRSQAASEEVANSVGVDAYFESPGDPDSALDVLLNRPDIRAVTIALPISIQANFVFRALSFGKHVLSEKPIAKDVETAKKLLKWYDANHGGKALWSVGENFRFREPVLFAFQQLRLLEGNLETFTLKMHRMVTKDDKFLQSSWRQNPQHQGGFILDAGVHFVAALRLLLSAVEVSITHVAAFTSLLQPNLPPKDTANATMRLSNGNSGTFSFSYGTGYDAAFEIHIVTDKGAVNLTDRRVTIVKEGDEEDTEQEIIRNFPPSDNSVRREIEVFAEGIKRGEVEKRGVPQEALEDLKIVQAVLESGEDGGAPREIA